MSGNEKTRNVNFRIPISMLDSMDRIIEEEFFSGRSELFRHAIREYLVRRNGGIDDPIN